MTRLKEFIKSHPTIYVPIIFIVNLLKFSGRRVSIIFFAVLTVVAVPIFLIKNRRIFENKFVLVYSTWSFGRQISEWDIVSRLYFPHRISLIPIYLPRNNPYLANCFEHNVDVFEFKSFGYTRSGSRKAQISYKILRFYCLLISALTNRFLIIEKQTVWSFLNCSEETLMTHNDFDSETLLKLDDHTGYYWLLKNRIGKPPRLPDSLLDKCRYSIQEKYPGFFDKPFGVLQLRIKGTGTGTWSDVMRNSGPHENYRPAVEYLIADGYHVLGLGETQHGVFDDIEGYFAPSGIELDYFLLNLFGLTTCNFFIGQSSGPVWLVASCSIPILLCDSLPHGMGTPNSGDLILHKRWIDTSTNRELGIKELYEKHAHLVYPHRIEGYETRPNTAQEISAAVKEFVCGCSESNYEELLERYWNLIPKNVQAAYSKNRLPYFILQNDFRISK